MHGVSVKSKLRAAALLFLCGCVLLLGALPAAAQKEKKSKKENKTIDTAPLTLPLPEEKQIDVAISGMLAAWQLGDVELLHKAYADDVSVVSGAWEPPILGWANYLADYQRQRARVQQVRMDRLNTYVHVSGTFGWACYQWEFSGVVDGQQSAARGQTTLVLEKRNGKWLIVHNHTSLVQTATPPAPTATPAGAPNPPQPESKPPSP